MFAELNVMADINQQTEVELGKRIEGFIGKVGDRLSLVEERTTAVAVQVQKVEKRQAALQESLDRVLESRMRLGATPGATDYKWGECRSSAGRADPAGGFNIFVQRFEGLPRSS